MDDMVSRVGSVEQTIAIVKENVAEIKPVTEVVRRLDGMVSKMNKDVAEMKPVTDDVRRRKLMGIGALGMIGIGGVALGVSFADALKRIGGLLIGRI